MSLWTIELIRADVGPKPWFLPGPHEKWLWRAFEGSDDYSVEARKEMYKKNDYLVGISSGRITPRADAIADAQAACNAYDLKRGREIREVIGYDTGLNDVPDGDFI